MVSSQSLCQQSIHKWLCSWSDFIKTLSCSHCNTLLLMMQPDRIIKQYIIHAITHTRTVARVELGSCSVRPLVYNNTANFLQNTWHGHGHPMACSLDWDNMGATGGLLLVQCLAYIFHQPVRRCIQYHVVLGHLMMARDHTLNSLKTLPISPSLLSFGVFYEN